MLEVASTSETSVNVCQTTRRNNPEDSHLHGTKMYNTLPALLCGDENWKLKAKRKTKIIVAEMEFMRTEK
jgi:hypothetical protein